MSPAASPTPDAASAATPEVAPESPAHAKGQSPVASPSPSSSVAAAAAASEGAAPRDDKMARPDDAPLPEDTSDADSLEEGETEDDPPLPQEPLPEGPPLPNEPVPGSQDDGWECRWEATYQSWYFVNRFTGASQWDNPRVAAGSSSSSGAAAAAAAAVAPSAPQPPVNEMPPAGGYNPAIHGDYDPNAWYAQAYKQEEEARDAAVAAAALPPEATVDGYGVSMGFNRWNGQAQSGDMGPGRHSDEAKSRRQMNAFFDVDAAANQHDGRSLKAERQNQRLSKSELKAFKEKRRARKEEKRRAWLLD
ncbi:hypothetical protein JDV02_000691 [Purpureocillium takamizusanense]|uniref:WW domain-containing protein n=1 Tax=Purpureocillium takamizusanense TaxID=2060973 RepID=A0A9Q8Q751_9HYPO|nr:uncharacterized protein JDV02_000691 [Purpureocillium takamizusanense]UNI14007.1 hypothetical protein JDV02_000691 [Purpureocillium takamizusanense]